ncbi:MAG TPA: methyltransferase domain-containing protein [Candidatus Limnocylindrales bacterium]|nr:methyltransferase domain-containing protein [Candidatus Limnocylindrales bacterium]
MTTTSEPVGLVIHSAFRYDLRLWLMSRGRESRLRNEMVDLASLQPGDAVLDVGCGTGTLAIAAARRVGPTGEVHGIDPSAEMIGRARRKARRAGTAVSLEVATAQSLPHPDARFDAVLSTFVLHQLPHDALPVAFAEMRRVLRPGGRLLLVDIGGPQGDRQTVHVRRAAEHGVHLFDLDGVVPHLGSLGLRPLAAGDLEFRLSRFERVRYVLATTADTTG